MSPDLAAWLNIGDAQPRPQVVLSLWRGLVKAPTPVPTVAEIQAAVAEHFRLSRLELISERRARYVARPRQISMWLCKKLTARSLPDIGRRHGGRDHTTVIAAVKRIERLIDEDQNIAQHCIALLRKLEPTDA